MPKYEVYGVAYASKYLGTFEANNKEEAEEMAMNSDANYFSLCHQCSGEVEFVNSTFDEFEVIGVVQ